MPETEVIDPELVDEALTKALVSQRTALQEVPGAAVFLVALQTLLKESEDQVSVCLRGHKTFLASADSVLKRKLADEDDWKRCVAMCIDAQKREAQAASAFEMSTQFAFRLHKALVGMRTLAAKPWETVKDRLSKHAGTWYMENERLKKEAAERIAKASEKESRDLKAEAEEAIAMGYMQQGQELLRQAQMVAAPVSLPSATPSLADVGGKVTPKWVVTVTDVVALAKAIVEGRFPLMVSVKKRGKGVPDGTMEERPLLVVDEVVLRALVDRMGKELERKLPGVSVIEDVAISGTGRK
jgi:hypothetical protein